MARRHVDNWMDEFDDEDLTLLGSRFVRALKAQEARRAFSETREDDWQHRDRKRIRPEPHRERFH